MQTKSNMIEVDSAKHTDAHSRGIMCAYWAAPSAVAARYLMHLHAARDPFLFASAQRAAACANLRRSHSERASASFWAVVRTL